MEEHVVPVLPARLDPVEHDPIAGTVLDEEHLAPHQRVTRAELVEALVHTVEEVVQALLQKMDSDQREIITLYYGELVGEDEAEALAALLQQNWPDQEIEVVAGGQPHYHYILSAE